MKLIPLTQGKFAKVDDADFEWLSKYKWYAKNTRNKDEDSGSYYAARFQRTGGNPTTIYMHREITNCPDGKEVDHKNRDRLDNQRGNLRVCTRKENLENRTHQYNKHKT